MRCAICNSEMDLWEKAWVLGKYLVEYKYCTDCHLIQVDNPHWLEEAYASAITSSDIGLVQRNLEMKRKVQSVIEGLFDWRERFIDYGGGTGLFTRLMRDSGYNFSWHDRFCDNQFSPGFVADTSGETTYELLSAIEVFEHLVEPVSSVRQMLELSPNILFSTETLSSPPPSISDWWYFGTEHGQHVTFYSMEALRALARKLDVSFVSNGKNLHLFSVKSVSPLSFTLVTSAPYIALTSALVKRPSLLDADYKEIQMSRGY